MKTKLHHVFSITMILIVFSGFAQKLSWKAIDKIENSNKIIQLNLDKNKTQFFELNPNYLSQKLNKVLPKGYSNKSNNSLIEIPNLNGDFDVFEIYETPVFSPSLAEKYPNIKSYTGISTDGKGARLRMSTSPTGIQAMVSYIDKSNIFVQQTSRGSNQYIVYNKSFKHKVKKAFECGIIDDFKTTLGKTNMSKIDEGGANNQTLQRFRIAVSVTGEYTQYFGGTIAGALAGINATLTRVNEVFENDMGVTFELVDATELIYTNSTTDPYSDADIGADPDNSGSLDGWSLQLQNNLTSTIGNSAYDLGHLFGASGGGGSAGCIGCVCENHNASERFRRNKGSAYSSPPGDIPEGDSFDINFVAHEIGHQMGARHTWSFVNEGGSNVQSEPGNGTTIMAYAGTGPLRADDIQLDSDAYFHYHSIKQILDNLASKSCQTTTPISNQSPVANAGLDYIIPIGTPYVLRGSAIDANAGDVLTYCWEQIDSGVVNSANFGPTLASGSLNRSLPPSILPERYIPNINSVKEGVLTESNPDLKSSWESVSTVSRSLNWALTVRDRNPSNALGNAQTSYDTMVINVDDSSGPFLVTSQNVDGIIWSSGNIETITWDVANTNSPPINTSLVNILLSTDGGITFPTVLVENTPNDGTQDITVPFLPAPFCRIKIEAVDNIYYAINSNDFSLNYIVDTSCNLTYASADNLNISILDGTESTNIINVPDNGTISDVKVSVNLEHTYISDLVIEVTHPNGSSSSKIWNRNCSDESNIVISFEDFASAINCLTAAAGNTYAPSESLEVFNGLDMIGDWEISVIDYALGDTGTLNSWSLEFCSQTATLNNRDINEPEDNLDVKVFPNPNEGSFTITFKSKFNNSDVKVIMRDVRGRTIFKKTYSDIVDFSENIKLDNTQSGMYFLTITDGVIYTNKKVIIN